ncbi:MAG: hypothetical protein AAF586_03405 [Planctomycetota bacterium]
MALIRRGGASALLIAAATLLWGRGVVAEIGPVVSGKALPAAALPEAIDDEEARIRSVVNAARDAVLAGDREALTALFDPLRVESAVRFGLRRHGFRENAIAATVRNEVEGTIDLIMIGEPGLRGLRVWRLHRESANRYAVVLQPYTRTGGSDAVWWWLERRPKGWRLVDTSKSNIGVQITAYIAALFDARQKVGGRLIDTRATSALTAEIELGFVVDNPLSAQRLRELRSAIASQGDSLLATMLRYHLAKRLCFGGELEQSLAELALIDRSPFDTRSSLTDWFTVVSLQALDRPTEARTRLLKLIEREGRIGLYVNTLAELHDARGEAKQADLHFAEAAISDANDADMVYAALSREGVATPELCERIVAAYVAPRAAYAAQADLLWEAERLEALAMLTDAFERLETDIALVALARSRLALSEEDQDEALRWAERAVETSATTAERSEMVAWRNELRTLSGQPATIYASMEDREAYFREASYDLYANEQIEGLKALIEARDTDLGSDGEGDYALAVARGDLALLEGDYGRAEVAFRRAWSVAEGDDINQGRYLVIHAMYLSGRWLDAYHSMARPHATFEQLARAMVRDRDATALAALIDLHRDGHDHDLEIPWFEARLAWLIEDPAAEREALEQARRNGVEEDQRGHLERRLILTNLALGDLDAAKLEARRSKRRDGDPYFDMLIAAHTGDVDLMMEAALDCVDRLGYRPSSFYDDPSIGPALRSEAFATFREAYPSSAEPVEDADGAAQTATDG